MNNRQAIMVLQHVQQRHLGRTIPQTYRKKKQFRERIIVSHKASFIKKEICSWFFVVLFEDKEWFFVVLFEDKEWFFVVLFEDKE